MKKYQRDKKRSEVKVRADIQKTKKIVREDIYDLINLHETIEEAEEAIREFIMGLSDDVLSAYLPHYDRLEIIRRITSDIPSYKVYDSKTGKKHSRGSKTTGKES